MANNMTVAEAEALLRMSGTYTQADLDKAKRIYLSTMHPDKFEKGSPEYIAANKAFPKIMEAAKVLKRNLAEGNGTARAATQATARPAQAKPAQQKPAPTRPATQTTRTTQAAPTFTRPGTQTTPRPQQAQQRASQAREFRRPQPQNGTSGSQNSTPRPKPSTQATPRPQQNAPSRTARFQPPQAKASVTPAPGKKAGSTASDAGKDGKKSGSAKQKAAKAKRTPGAKLDGKTKAMVSKLFTFLLIVAIALFAVNSCSNMMAGLGGGNSEKAQTEEGVELSYKDISIEEFGITETPDDNGWSNYRSVYFLIKNNSDTTILTHATITAEVYDESGYYVEDEEYEYNDVLLPGQTDWIVEKANGVHELKNAHIEEGGTQWYIGSYKGYTTPYETVSAEITDQNDGFGKYYVTSEIRNNNADDYHEGYNLTLIYFNADGKPIQAMETEDPILNTMYAGESVTTTDEFGMPECGYYDHFQVIAHPCFDEETLEAHVTEQQSDATQRQVDALSDL